MNDRGPHAPVVVVGGGLTGLAAATFVARQGRPVLLLEQSDEPGGRARSRVKDGFIFNLGGHALYRGAQEVLSELGVAYRGGTPAASGFAVADGKMYQLPAGPLSIFTTGLLGWRAKLELAGLFGALPRMDLGPLQNRTVADWLETGVRQPDLRRLVRALLRLATYADDPERQSAGAALAQLRSAVAHGVLYVDGGWQSLVDGLRRSAQEAGAEVRTGARVVRVEHDEAVRGVCLADGTSCPASAVIVAAGPAAVCALAGGDETVLEQWAAAAVPVKAACLDVALRRLPRPGGRFALGIDRPLYLSVHSAVAKLAPAGGAVIHTIKYLGPSPAPDPKADEQELEGLLDLVQPGWRDALVERRFLPGMTVANALVTAAQGGTVGRPGPEVPGVRNLCVAGDWVGPDGMLVEAGLASARRAAALLARPAAVPGAAASSG